MFHVKHSGAAVEPTGWGIYIHWPYCSSKCPYCDFNSHVSAWIDHDAWRSGYLAELERVAAETADRRVDTVFFGGGTPSLMDPAVVADVLAAVQRHWRVANDWEVTLEANPGSVEAGRFRAFRDAGVNRVSLGVQSLDDAHLARLGRRHTANEARAAFAIARDVFPRVSFDLIYARQDQTPDAWRKELEDALSMAVDHLSLYQLTIEDGTVFGALHQAGKLRGLPDEDRGADMYLMTQELCAQAGFVAYEVSNHARPGAESRHNRLYWTGGDFAGIGPGAHGRLTVGGRRWATECPRDPRAWLEAAQGGGATETRSELHPRDQALEYLVMGLRVSEGLDMGRMERLAGRMTDGRIVSEFETMGLLMRADGRLCTTLPGRMVLNTLAVELSAAWGL